MKKFISIIFTIALLITPFAYVQANDEVGFLEAIANTSKLESYKSLQSIYGNFKSDGHYDIAEGNFRLSFSGNVNSDTAYEENSYLRVSGFMQVNLTEKPEGEYYGERYYPKSFDKLIINFNGEVASIFDDAIYLKFSNLNVSVEGMDSVDIEDMNMFLEEISPYKNKWLRIPMNYLTDPTSDNLEYSLGTEFDTDLFEQETVIKYFQDNGIKEGIRKYAKDVLELIKNEGELTDSEYITGKKVIDEIIDAQYFNLRDIVSGRNVGFKFFTLNKSAIINVITKIGNLTEDPLTASDIQEIRSGLGQFSLAGIYRINEENGVLDNFLIKFTLRNYEPLQLSVKYRSKISNFNSAANIQGPSEYIEIDEIEEFQEFLSY